MLGQPPPSARSSEARPLLQSPVTRASNVRASCPRSRNTFVPRNPSHPHAMLPFPMGSFLFFAFSWWGILLRIVAIVHFIRRRPDFFWIWVIMIHPIGALVYIVVEVIPDP